MTAMLVAGMVAVAPLQLPSATAQVSTEQVKPSSAATVSSNSDSEFAETLEKDYIDPDRVYSTDVRWWLGDAAHTDETLLEEIQALYDGGFRGVELAMQDDGAAPNATYGYGSEMWTHKWNLMMNKLLDLGMSVYLTSGTNWATSNVPGLDPSSQAAMQNLTQSNTTVAPGATLRTLPTQATADRKAGATFYTAYAYRVVSGTTIDPNSFIDLTPLLTQGANVWTQNLTWVAPTDGTYRVFAMWQQGTFHSSSPASSPAYTTNYFDERGVAALRDYWETHYLSDPALREKILAGDVEVFMDSLETDLGNGFIYWSEDMAAQFQERKGYDVRPYLYLLIGLSRNRLVGSPYTSLENGWYNVDNSTFQTNGLYRWDGEEQKRQDIIGLGGPAVVPAEV